MLNKVTVLGGLLIQSILDGIEIWLISKVVATKHYSY